MLKADGDHELWPEKGLSENGGGGTNSALPETFPPKAFLLSHFPHQTLKRGQVEKGQQKPPEGTHLQNPEINWKSRPIAPRFSAPITSQLNNVENGVRGGEKRPEQSFPPLTSLGPALPHPHSWGGGRAWERVTSAGLKRGGVVVPGGRKRRKKLLPFWPTPLIPAPTLGRGAQQTGWRWGQGGQGQSASTGPGSAWRAGGGGFAPRRTPSTLG